MIDKKESAAAARRATAPGRRDYTPMFADAAGPWHRWFAWRPVNTADQGWVWLERVWRRRCQMHDHLPGPLDQFWQYARAAECQRCFGRSECWDCTPAPARAPTPSPSPTQSKDPV